VQSQPRECPPKECKSNQKVHRSEESGRFFKIPHFDHGCLFPSHLRVDYPMSRSQGSRRCDQCDQKELQGRPRRHPSRQNHPPFFQAPPLGIPSLGTPGQPWPPQGARHQLDPLWTSICLQFPPPQHGARHRLAPPRTSICLHSLHPQQGARHLTHGARHRVTRGRSQPFFVFC